MKSKAGYLEIEHTADRAIRVWGPDLPGLLQQAALGMYSLMDILPNPRIEIEETLQIQAADEETLLVRFLSQLLSSLEAQGQVFTSILPEIHEGAAEIKLSGYRAGSVRVEIKAVTFHGLKVTRTASGLEAVIVFDV